jgi:2-polyprenyl-3-methyl-5-hydroxy-6-metoxy-1,4-benzoquinol methylase
LKRYKKAHLCQCRDCGFIFSQQIPSPEELVHFYSDAYDVTSYFSPITEQRYEALLDSLEPYRKTNKILDIGSGYGFFLEVAKRKGWEVYGTELSDKTVKVCTSKGIEMLKGEITNDSFESGMFDVIVAIELLEHINYPKEFVKQAKRLLRPGGKVYLTTPNFNSILRYRLKEKYNIIEYPNHLCYYTKKSLVKLFSDQGFRTERITTTGMSITRVKTSKGKSNQEYVSETSDDEMMRYRIEKNAFLKLFKRVFNWKLNLFKVGDSLKGEFVIRN